MQIHESTWTTPDGVNLYSRCWQPDLPARAVVVIVHGLGEHCARYDHVAKLLTQNGLQVLSFDHRGHGRSQGIRGHIPSYEHVNQDIDHILNAAAESSPGLPIFLYGHSMGGALVLFFALTHPNQLKGVICTSPGLGSTDPLPPVKLALAKILYKLAPKVTIPNGLDLNNLSHNPEVISAYSADPLNTNQVSARLGLDIYKNGAWIVAHAGQFNLPLLLMQGGGDHIVSLALTREFAAGVPSQLITYKEWDGLFHELHNEPDQDQVFQVILDWISAQTGV